MSFAKKNVKNIFKNFSKTTAKEANFLKFGEKIGILGQFKPVRALNSKVLDVGLLYTDCLTNCTHCMA